MRIEILIAGFGGQGIIFAAKILARALAFHKGMYVLQTQSYGPKARGGACRSEVIISNQEIDYPEIADADYFLALSKDAYTKYIKHLSDNGTLILDYTNVDESQSIKTRKQRRINIPATEIAEELGDKLVSNMVMLGALSAMEKAISLDSLKRSLRDNLTGKLLKLNLKAVESGNVVCRSEAK